MQQIRESIRLFAGQLSERSPDKAGRRVCSIANRKLKGASQSRKLSGHNSNAKAVNTNIVLFFISCIYQRQIPGTIH